MSKDGEEELARIARAVLARELEPTVAVRELVPRLHDLKLALSRFGVTISGIDSDSDGFPVRPDVRARWNAAALAEQDKRRLAWERRVQPDLEEACRALIAALAAPEKGSAKASPSGRARRGRARSPK